MSTDKFIQEKRRLSEKLTFKLIDFQIRVHEALKNFPKCLDVFLNSTRKNDAIVLNCALPCEANPSDIGKREDCLGDLLA